MTKEELRRKLQEMLDQHLHTYPDAVKSYAAKHKPQRMKWKKKHIPIE